MLFFYDCLWHDGQNLVDRPLRTRRQHLEQIIQPVVGLSHLGERQEVHFRSKDAKQELRDYFEYAIRQKWEGFVLKGVEDPYFSAGGHTNMLKLKKDYITGMGDVADLCIIGGRRDATEAARIGGNLSWTSFYLSCLKDKEAVQQYGIKPEFRIIDVLDCNNMSKETTEDLNRYGKGFHNPFFFDNPQYTVVVDQPEIQRKLPTVLFTKPFVVDVTGGGYEKAQSISYYKLRFPRNLKLHFDRPFTQTHTFDELQNMAEKSFRPLDTDEQDEVDWYQKLIHADPKRCRSPSLDSQATQSPSVASTASVRTLTPTASTSRPAYSVAPPESPLQFKGPRAMPRQDDAHRQVKIISPQAATRTPRTCASSSSRRPSQSTASVSTASPSPMEASRAKRLSDRPASQSIASVSTASPSPAEASMVKPLSNRSASPSPAGTSRIVGHRQGVKRRHEELEHEELDNSSVAAKRYKIHDIAAEPLRNSSTAAAKGHNTAAARSSPSKGAHSPTKTSTSKHPASSPIKQRRPLAELENVSATRNIHKSSPRSAEASAMESPNKSITMESAKTEASQNQRTPHPRRPSSFPLDTLISKILWPESTVPIGSPEDPDGVHMVTVEDESPRVQIALPRSSLIRAYREYWALKRQNIRAHLEPPPCPRTQNRVLLFYTPEIESHLRDSVSEGAESYDLNSVLPEPEMQKLFVRAFFISASEESEDYEMRDISDWEEAMELLADMPSEMFFS